MTLFEAARSCLEELGATLDVTPELGALRVGVTGTSGRWLVHVKVDEASRLVVFYGQCPLDAPPDRRDDVQTLITRINHGLRIGAFELDLDAGGIRFRTSVDFEGAEPQAAIIARLYWANVAAMDAYLPALVSVIEGNEAPEAAFIRATR